MIYLINVVFSDGLFSGRECMPFSGTDKESVIKQAYERYCLDYEEASLVETGLFVEADLLTEEEFSGIMEKGFTDNNEFVLLQCEDYHIQYEPTIIRR